MCCFTGPSRVSNTRIFARRLDGNRQALAYEMTYSAAGELAMVLPLPVPLRSAEDAVRFVDLSGYPGFFADLARGFETFGLRTGAVSGNVPAPVRAPLAVHDVGSFEASFLPSAADFDRLDPRFRLPAGFLDALPLYASFGFAVFKLKAADRRPTQIHPMALVFPNRCDDELFFPTVHVHDGTVADHASFDHTLYLQTPAGGAPTRSEDFAFELFVRAGKLPPKAGSDPLLGDGPSEEALALLERVRELDPDHTRVPTLPFAREPALRTRLDADPLRGDGRSWSRSRDTSARAFMKASAGLVALEEPVWKRDVNGWLPNADVWVPVPRPG